MCSTPPEKDAAGIPMSEKVNVHPNTAPTSGWLPSDALLKVPIKPEEEELFTRINIKVREYMSTYDSSHNYEHIQRVVCNANKLLTAELEKDPSLKDKVDPLAIFLGCLTHDMSDHKYVDGVADPENIIANMLMECGCSGALSQKVQLIANSVSYSTESANPERIKDVLTQHPELTFIQDADRFDALGMIGMGRCFTFGGANLQRRHKTIHWSVQYHWTKLQFLPGMMKTEEGRMGGEKRWERLRVFREMWEDETDVSSVLKPSEER